MRLKQFLVGPTELLYFSIIFHAKKNSADDLFIVDTGLLAALFIFNFRITVPENSWNFPSKLYFIVNSPSTNVYDLLKFSKRVTKL